MSTSLRVPSHTHFLCVSPDVFESLGWPQNRARVMQGGTRNVLSSAFRTFLVGPRRGEAHPRFGSTLTGNILCFFPHHESNPHNYLHSAPKELLTLGFSNVK